MPGLKIEMPDFDDLARLAQTDLEAFEQLKKDLVEQLIHDCAEDRQPKLHRLQFRYEGVIRGASNPVHACVLLSNLMHDSVALMFEQVECFRSSDYKIKRPEHKKECHLCMVKE